MAKRMWREDQWTQRVGTTNTRIIAESTDLVKDVKGK